MRAPKISSLILSLLIFFASTNLGAKPYVKGNLTGQLGNQLFVIAAATSLALENDAEAIFPDLVNPPPHLDKKIPHNYKMIFSKLNVSAPKKQPRVKYIEPYFQYKRIPYRPHMEISGYFQSEKYFINHKKEIIKLFSPNNDIKKYLYGKYSDIINHPNTVSVHYRSYLKEDPEQNTHITYGKKYYQKAINLFPKDALFVIFTNDIADCKKLFADFPQQMRFIENEDYIYDFYLMSLCKHHIISNSSFSWWAAYLNTNPEKTVVAPMPWFNPKANLNTKDLLPENWIKIFNP